MCVVLKDTSVSTTARKFFNCVIIFNMFVYVWMLFRLDLFVVSLRSVFKVFLF